jgi:hypothetical protein
VGTPLVGAGRFSGRSSSDLVVAVRDKDGRQTVRLFAARSDSAWTALAAAGGLTAANANVTVDLGLRGTALDSIDGIASGGDLDADGAEELVITGLKGTEGKAFVVWGSGLWTTRSAVAEERIFTWNAATATGVTYLPHPVAGAAVPASRNLWATTSARTAAGTGTSLAFGRGPAEARSYRVLNDSQQPVRARGSRSRCSRGCRRRFRMPSTWPGFGSATTTARPGGCWRQTASAAALWA